MKVLVYACSLASIMLVGCATVKQDVKVSNANVDLEPVMFEPVTEVIGKKVVGRATDSSTFWGLISTESPSEFVDSKAPTSKSFTEIESAAIADACEKSGADIILDPKVTTDEYVGFLGFNRETTVKVDGVPAKIVGAREIPLEEVYKEMRKKNTSSIEKDDFSINIDGWLSIKYGKLDSKASEDIGGGSLNDFVVNLDFDLTQNISLIGGFHNIKNKDSEYSFKANVYNLDLKYKFLYSNNLEISAFLGASYIDYEYEYYYDSYYTSWTSYGVGERYWMSGAQCWDYDYYIYIPVRIPYRAWGMESDESISPRVGLTFKYDSDNVYFGASFIYIKAYDSGNQNFYLADDTMSLELDLGLNLTSFLRLDVAYMMDFGKEDSFSGVYGGATLLF